MESEVVFLVAFFVDSYKKHPPNNSCAKLPGLYRSAPLCRLSLADETSPAVATRSPEAVVTTVMVKQNCW